MHQAPPVAALQAVAWQYLVGGLALAAWSAIFEDWSTLQPSPGLLGSLLYLGIVGSAGASWAWYRLLARDSLIGINGLTLLTPVLGVGWAGLLFGESLGGAGWIGLVLTVVGVAVVSLPRSPVR